MSNIQSIERAFAILRVIASHEHGLGVTAISQNTALPKSTVSRILTTLDNEGAVARTADGRFTLGDGLIELVGSLPNTRTLRTLARPILQALADHTGENVALVQPDGLHVHYIDHVQGEHVVRVRDWTGERLPLHVTSAGKVFLAHWHEADLERFLARPLARFTRHTITEPAKMRAELARVRQQGYATIHEEQNDAVSGLAAPVYGRDGAVIAALNIYGPTFRFDGPATHARLVELTLDSAAELSAKLQSL